MFAQIYSMACRSRVVKTIRYTQTSALSLRVHHLMTKFTSRGPKRIHGRGKYNFGFTI